MSKAAERHAHVGPWTDLVTGRQIEPPESASHVNTSARLTTKKEMKMTHVEAKTRIRAEKIRQEQMTARVRTLSEKVNRLQRGNELIAIESLLERHPEISALERVELRKMSLSDVKAVLHTMHKAASTYAPGDFDARDADAMDQAMGVAARHVQMPGRRSDGAFVLHTVRPSDVRRAQMKR